MSPEDICRSYTSSIVVRRWAATWLDFLLFIGALVGLLVIFRGNLAGLGLGIWLLLAVAYYPLLEGLTGKTFGKWVCQLKVVDASGATPGLGKATIRTLLRLIEVNPLLMGGLPAGIIVLGSQKRQRLGDMAANTYVLQSEDLVRLSAQQETTPSPVL